MSSITLHRSASVPRSERAIKCAPREERTVNAAWLETAFQAGLVFLAAAYYAWYLPRLPFGMLDEGYLLYIAHAIQHGHIPYHDIQLNSYLPGLFYLFAGVLSVLGDNVLHVRGAIAFSLTLTPWLTYRAAVLVSDRRWAAAAALAVLLVPGPLWKFYVGLLNAALLLCGLSWLISARGVGPSATESCWGCASLCVSMRPSPDRHCSCCR